MSAYIGAVSITDKRGAQLRLQVRPLHQPNKTLEMRAYQPLGGYRCALDNGWHCGHWHRTPEDAVACAIARGRRGMSTAEDTTYNGWKNYPTWAVNLWIDNEEPLYRERRERVAEILEDAARHVNVREGLWTVERAQRYLVADGLREWVRDELAPDLEGFADDLFGYALEQVDWYEIADAAMEDLK